MQLLLLLAVCAVATGSSNEPTGRPEQVHIALGDTTSALAIGWVTLAGGAADCSRDSVIKFGNLDTQMDRWSHPGTVQRLDIAKKKKKRKEIELRTTFFHNAVLHGLAAGMTYYYSVGSAASADCWSDVHSFRMPGASTARPLTVAIFGDLGIKRNEAVSCLVSGAQDGSLDLVIHAGDFAYDLSDHRGRKGDEWMRTMEPITAHIPYMVAPGNHERNDRTPFLQYAVRFQNMPASQSGTLDFALPALAAPLTVANSRFYSFNVGLVHFIAIDTEVFFSGNEALLAKRQLAWLRADLTRAAASRVERPWIVAFGHRPLFCSVTHDECEEDGRLLQQRLAALFHEFGVDLYVSGHQHVYERSFDVAPGSSAKAAPVTQRTTVNMLATTYILSGVAGPDKLKKRFKLAQPDFSAVRIAGHYGFGHLTVFNASHLGWAQVLCDSRAPADEQGATLDSVVLVQHNHGSFLHRAPISSQSTGGSRHGLLASAEAGAAHLLPEEQLSGAVAGRAGAGAPAKGMKWFGVWGWALIGTLLGLGLGCAGVAMALVCTLKLVRARGGRAPASVFDLHVLSGRHSRIHRKGDSARTEEEEVFMQQDDVEDPYQPDRARSV